MTTQNSPALAGRARATLVVVFVLSAIGLAYEVTLTRLFSLMFQYHYVFLIVSVSLAGLGVGAALAALVARRDWAWSDLVHVAILLAILLLGSAIVLSQLRSATRTIIAIAAALLPFIGLGFLNALLFARFAKAGGLLYAVDLLGGTVGLILALVLVSWLGAYNTVLALVVLASAVALVLSILAPNRSLNMLATGAVIVAVLLLLLNTTTGWLAFYPDRLEDAPPDKTMLTLLEQNPTAAITETRWGPFARLDIVETSDGSVRYVFTDGGAGSTMVRYSGDDRRVSWLQQDIAYLPFLSNPAPIDRVLILGAGAGKDVLLAHLAGVPSITAVEINPELVDLTRDYADYNGGVYDWPNVETVVADGRTYIERSDATYDLIYANLVYSQAAVPGTSALSESYIFTREALQTYWAHLSDNGSIGFVTHQGIEGLRLLVAALDMLEREGMSLQEALQHVALATRQSNDPQTRNGVVVITRQPWTAEHAALFVEEAHQRSVGLLYLPGYQELGLEGLVSGLVTLDEFIDGNADEYNFTPTTDNQPFFYQFTPGLPDQVSELLFISLILAGVYMSWALFFFVRRQHHWKRFSLTWHFALLGAAFILVEIPLIQQFSLLIGQPSLSLATVIGALLVSSGVGSLASTLIPVTALPRRAAMLVVCVALMVGASLIVYPAIINWALPFEEGARVGITILALLPLGIVMGIPFPSGLRIAHVVDPAGVAAFWGANAVMSVLGSALAMTLAITIGFSAALLLGATLYAVVAVLIWLIWSRLLN